MARGIKEDVWWVCASAAAEEVFKEVAGELGYVRVIREATGPYANPFPDFWCVKKDRRVDRVEVELVASDFELHGHSFEEVDLIAVAEDNLWLYGKKYPVPVIQIPRTRVDRAPSTARCVASIARAIKYRSAPNAANRTLAVLKWFGRNDSCRFCSQILRGKGASKQHLKCLGDLQKTLKTERDIDLEPYLEAVHQ